MRLQVCFLCKLSPTNLARVSVSLIVRSMNPCMHFQNFKCLETFLTNFALEVSALLVHQIVPLLQILGRVKFVAVLTPDLLAMFDIGQCLTLQLRVYYNNTIINGLASKDPFNMKKLLLGTFSI